MRKAVVQGLAGEAASPGRGPRPAGAVGPPRRRRLAAPRTALLALALVAPVLGGCAVAELSAAKARLVAYHDGGRYEREVARAVASARRYLEGALPACRAAGERPAVLLDLDETALSNWSYEVELDFGYSIPTWTEWVERVEATAIEPTLHLYRWALDEGAAVFFLTGRDERTREATAANLRSVGYDRWAGLLMRPDDHGGVSTAQFKAAARARLVEEGWTIVLNLGDQPTDFEGGHFRRGIQLPNPFY